MHSQESVVAHQLKSFVSKLQDFKIEQHYYIKNFDESLFLNDLENDIITFTANLPNIDDDFATWHSIVMKYLDNHAPMKSK